MSNLQNFKQLIFDAFNLDELREICFALGIRYDELPGDKLSRKVESLLVAVYKAERFEAFCHFLVKERSQIDWPVVKEIETYDWKPYIKEVDLPASIQYWIGNVGENAQIIQGDHNIQLGDRAVNIGGDVGEGATIITGDTYGLSYEQILNIIESLKAEIKGGSFDSTSPLTRELDLSDYLEKARKDFEPKVICIPSGKFLMGSDDHGLEEKPIHEINLPAYWIAKYPITNRQYAEYLWQSNNKVANLEMNWDGDVPPLGEEDFPVTGVSWFDAIDYCVWLTDKTGRRYSLPSEAEWEKAARGAQNSIFPWANMWEENRCNNNLAEIVSVRLFDPQNNYGCFDMVGNCREWTATAWGLQSKEPDSEFKYPWKNDSRENTDLSIITRRVFRGGRYKDILSYRCSKKGGYSPEKGGPKNNRHGFRVVLKFD